MSSQQRFLKLGAVAIASAVLTQVLSSAGAAPITWGAAQTISGSGSQVVTTGTLVYARTHPGRGAITVNGVNFTTGTSASTFFWVGGANDNVGGSSTAVTGNYGTLVGGRAWNPSNTFYFTFASLIKDATYVIQAWANAGTNTQYINGTTTLYSGTTTSGASVTLDNNTSNASGGAGQFVTGTFTADSSLKQSFVAGPTNNTALVNAVQLRILAVPEPSTLAMAALGIAGVGMWVVRRRRRSEEEAAAADAGTTA